MNNYSGNNNGYSPLRSGGRIVQNANGVNVYVPAGASYTPAQTPNQTYTQPNTSAYSYAPNNYQQPANTTNVYNPLLNNSTLAAGVEDTLNQLQYIIENGERNAISSEQIEQAILRLAQAGRIKIIGKGTNRIAVQVLGDIRHLISIDKPVIIKVPYAIGKGINDNLREYLLYTHLINQYNATGNAEILDLINLLPAVSRIQGYSALIAQEMVVPIQETLQPGTPSDNIAAECTKKVLNDQNKKDYLKLMELMDKYCVFADLNPLVTPFQFGFKQTPNGGLRITILDTGYTIPKFGEMITMLSTGEIERRNYIIVGRDLLVQPNETKDETKDSFAIVPNNRRLSKVNVVPLYTMMTSAMGVYILDNGTTETNVKDLFKLDMNYFREVFEKLKAHARMNPNSPIGAYFGVLTNFKGSLLR